MPVHDWTRVRPGTFHDFHCSWITHLKERLNGGLLPPNYYALAEQPAGEAVPDVITLETTNSGPDSGSTPDFAAQGVTAVAERPPKVNLTVRAEAAICAARRRSLSIRHASGDRIVALIEILSPGNKKVRAALDRFVHKTLSAFRHGYHLLIVDLFPPGPYDPQGIHGAVWAEIDDANYTAPEGKPLTLVAYEVGLSPTAYVEPTAVGSVLPDMPLFLEYGWYIDVPLEQTYMLAWRGLPQRWRSVLEESPG